MLPGSKQLAQGHTDNKWWVTHVSDSRGHPLKPHSATFVLQRQKICVGPDIVP